jgi:hypothetical protein
VLSVLIVDREDQPLPHELDSEPVAPGAVR